MLRRCCLLLVSFLISGGAFASVIPLLDVSFPTTEVLRFSGFDTDRMIQVLRDEEDVFFYFLDRRPNAENLRVLEENRPFFHHLVATITNYPNRDEYYQKNLVKITRDWFPHLEAATRSVSQQSALIRGNYLLTIESRDVPDKPTVNSVTYRRNSLFDISLTHKYSLFIEPFADPNQLRWELLRVYSEIQLMKILEREGRFGKTGAYYPNEKRTYLDWLEGWRGQEYRAVQHLYDRLVMSGTTKSLKNILVSGPIETYCSWAKAQLEWGQLTYGVEMAIAYWFLVHIKEIGVSLGVDLPTVFLYFRSNAKMYREQIRDVINNDRYTQLYKKLVADSEVTETNRKDIEDLKEFFNLDAKAQRDATELRDLFYDKEQYLMGVGL